MRILVVAATSAEIAPVVAGLGAGRSAGDRVQAYVRGPHQIDVLTTGVGMVATAAWCSRTIASKTYDLALNLGVCGSFDPTLPPGRVVHVVSESLPELGAENGEAFLSIQDLGLLGPNEFPFQAGRIVNHKPPAHAMLRDLPSVNGITVNTVHGHERSIAAVTRRCQPQVESMEGAAFLYACLIHGLPCAEIRAVSNVVERRNRSAWRLEEAIANLGDTVLALLDQA